MELKSEKLVIKHNFINLLIVLNGIEMTNRTTCDTRLLLLIVLNGIEMEKQYFCNINQ